MHAVTARKIFVYLAGNASRQLEHVQSALMVKRKTLNGDAPLLDEEQAVKRQKFEPPIEEIRSARQLRAALLFQQDAVSQLRDGTQ